MAKVVLRISVVAKSFCVACPCDVADEIFWTLIEVDVQIEPLFIFGVAYFISQNPCVTVAVVAVEIHQEVFVFGEFVAVELG